MKRRTLQILAALAAAWLGFGLWTLARRAPRPPAPPGEIHGAYHVHTTKSDGRGALDEVVAAAKTAGLQFLVVTDHNVMSPEDAGYHDGILVVEGSEISAPYGHVVGLGISRALTKEERQKDALGSVRALGGQAMLAHPFHPRRPFTRWLRDDWVGLEVLSNDSFWGRTLADRAFWRVGLSALAIPWDSAQAGLAFFEEPRAELALYDALSAVRRHPFLCASDAHGWPSYRAAFESFSMHVPVSLTGDAAVDVPRVVEGLLSRAAYCVVDGVAPAWGVRLSLAPGRDRIDLAAENARDPRARFEIFRTGAPLGGLSRAAGGWAFDCGGPCPPGEYRVEGRWVGRPWLFTNPVKIE